MYILFVLLLFVVCQVILEKGFFKKILDIRLSQLLFGSIGLIAVVVFLSRFIPFGTSLIVGVTVITSSAICYKYRKKFDEMERGKKV